MYKQEKTSEEKQVGANSGFLFSVLQMCTTVQGTAVTSGAPDPAQGEAQLGGFDLLCSLRMSQTFLFHPMAKPSSGGATVQP